MAHWLFHATPTINYSSQKRFLGKPFFYSWQQFSNFTLARVESVLLKEAVARIRSVKKVFLEISQNSQENSATLFKKRLWHRCFPVNFMKFLRTPLLAEHLRWVLLYLLCVIISKWRWTLRQPWTLRQIYDILHLRSCK